MTSIIPTGVVGIATGELIKAAMALEAQAAALRALAGEREQPDADAQPAKRNPPTVLHKGGPVSPLHGIPTTPILNAARRSTNAPGGYL